VRLIPNTRCLYHGVAQPANADLARNVRTPLLPERCLIARNRDNQKNRIQLGSNILFAQGVCGACNPCHPIAVGLSGTPMTNTPAATHSAMRRLALL